MWKLAAPLLFLLSKAKFLLVGLFQAKTLLSMIVTAGFYRQSGAPWMVAVVIGSIYVHEMGHHIEAKYPGALTAAEAFVSERMAASGKADVDMSKKFPGGGFA
mgnify:CR=1 FL=1